MATAESSASSALCPACGRALPGGKWSGLCPRCLIATLSEEEEGAPGDSIVPGFSLLEEIARGGMGVVYRAQQQHPPRIVALKMILPHLLDSPMVRARFQAEAEAVAKLDHPNVLPIYEADENRGTPYLAMKFVPGGSLAARRAEFIGQTQVCARIVAAAARGVQHAHERGILHRDLKPGNLLLDQQGSDSSPTPMVTDFGLARALELEPGAVTGPASFLGTLGYIAPELFFGRKASATVQSDIYSLGAILFELLTGQLPFADQNGLEALRRAEEGATPSPRSLNASVPKDLDAICLTCLQREPAARYSSAAALAEDLERFLDGRSVRARQVPGLVRVARWARRRPATAALAAVASLLFIAAIAGSVLFTARVTRERDRAAASEKNAQAQLWRAYLEQARATRIAPQMGRRFATLDALAAAARLHPSLELRNAAAAALGLEDLQLEHRWAVPRRSIDTPVAFDSTLEWFAVPQAGDRISLRRLSDNEELASFPAAPVTQLQFSKDRRFLVGRVAATGATLLWSLPLNPSASSPVLVLETNGAEKLSETAFTPDSRTLAAPVGPGLLAFYDLTQVPPREIARWHDLPSVRALAFDPSGERLALTSTDDSVAEIREGAGGRLWQRLAHPAGATGVDWSPDGSELATGCEDFQVRTWDTATGALKHVLEGHQNVVARPLYHPSGRLLATSGWDATLRLWSPSQGRFLFNGPACHDWQRFSSDGSHLAIVNYLDTIEVYRVATIPAVRVFEPAAIKTVAHVYTWLDFSADSRFLCCPGAGGVRVWDALSGKESAYLPLPGTETATSLFTKSGEALVVADEKRGVTLWPASGGGQFGPAETWRTGEGWQVSSRSLTGNIALINSDLGLADVTSVDQSHHLQVGPHPAIRSAMFSPDEKRLVTGTWQGKDVKIWDLARGQLLATLPAGESAYAFWRSNHTVISVQLNEVAEWSENEAGVWRRGRTWSPDPGRTFWVYATASADGNWLALPQSGDHIRLVDASSGEELVTLEPPRALGFAFVRFSPDGHFLAACGVGQQMAVWDLPQLRRELAKLRLDWPN